MPDSEEATWQPIEAAIAGLVAEGPWVSNMPLAQGQAGWTNAVFQRLRLFPRVGEESKKSLTGLQLHG